MLRNKVDDIGVLVTGDTITGVIGLSYKHTRDQDRQSGSN